MWTGKIGDLILHLGEESMGYGIIIECDKGNFRYPYYYNAFWSSLNQFKWVAAPTIKFIQSITRE